MNQTINIAITVNGAPAAANAIAGVGNAATRAHQSVFNLRNLLIGFTVKKLVDEFVKFSDAATRIDNRLNVLTGSVSRSNELFTALNKVANDTRTSIEPTIDLYARLERSTVGLNITSQQLVDVTKGINQSFQIFGNSSKEATAAMIQFSQGLSSGVLRGDELRSVLEQAPRLAKAIADGLGALPEGAALGQKYGKLFKDFETGKISAELLSGSLRGLGKDGKLTSDLLIKGLLTQLPKLQEEFARTKPTIEGAFTVINNKITELARSPEFRALATNIATSILDIADGLKSGFDQLLPFFTVLAQIGPLVFDLIGIFGQFTSDVITGFTDILSASVVAFSGTIDNGKGAAENLSTVFVNAFKIIYNSFKTLADTLARGAAAIGGFFIVAAHDVLVGLAGLFKALQSTIEAVINVGIDGINAFRKEGEKLDHVKFTNVEEAVEKGFINPLDAAMNAADEASANLATVFKPFDTAIDHTGAALIKFGKNTDEALAKLKNLKDAQTSNTMNNIIGGKEALPGQTPLSANDQRRFDSFNDTMAQLVKGADDGKEALTKLKHAEEQYEKLAKDPEISKRLKDRGAQYAQFGMLEQKYTDQTIDELEKLHTANADAAQVDLDHYAAQKLLNTALKDGLTPTQAQIDALSEVLKHEREVVDAQKQRENILTSLTRKADEYRAVLAATSELEAKGTITKDQGDKFVKDTEVGKGVDEAKKFVSDNKVAAGDPNEAANQQLKDLADQQKERLSILDQARLADATNAQYYLDLKAAAENAYAETVNRLHTDNLQQQVQLQHKAFDDLLTATKQYAGENTGIVKALYAVTRAYSIAEAFINVYKAMTAALASGPFPANLAALAAVAASGLNLLSVIKGAPAPTVAAKDGGYIRGPGGPRDDAVSASLSNGEYVINAAATAQNRDLLDAINSGRFNAGQGGPRGDTVINFNVHGVRDVDGFNKSRRQIESDLANTVVRATVRN